MVADEGRYNSGQSLAVSVQSDQKKKLCSFVSVVVSELWERFLTAITRVFVAKSHSHQPLIATSITSILMQFHTGLLLVD